MNFYLFIKKLFYFLKLFFLLYFNSIIIFKQCLIFVKHQFYSIFSIFCFLFQSIYNIIKSLITTIELLLTFLKIDFFIQRFYPLKSNQSLIN